jgi:hypothetical protein
VVTEILSQELGHRQISVNSVFPGPTKTPLMEKQASKEELERIGQSMNLGRMGEPEDIARVVAFLANQEAGAGLIISEGLNISEQAIGSPFTPGIYTEQQIASWKKVTDAVHEKAGKFSPSCDIQAV